MKSMMYCKYAGAIGLGPMAAVLFCDELSTVRRFQLAFPCLSLTQFNDVAVSSCLSLVASRVYYQQRKRDCERRSS